MQTVRDLLKNKGAAVTAINADASVYDAALLMNGRRIGAVVVMDGDRMVGILSERDLLTRVLVARKDPTQTPVRDVMTSQVCVCSLDSPVAECRAAMTHRRIRHLPVVDEQHQLAGMLSIGDIVAHEIESQEKTIHFLHEYMQGPN